LRSLRGAGAVSVDDDDELSVEVDEEVEDDELSVAAGIAAGAAVDWSVVVVVVVDWSVGAVLLSVLDGLVVVVVLLGAVVESAG
jgi:hypothetical protein